MWLDVTLKLTSFVLPVWDTIPAGDPTPARGYEDDRRDLHALLVRHPTGTFCIKVRGHHLRSEGSRNGSILVIDLSMTPNPS